MTKTQNITRAFHQWAERPVDERFETLEDMAAATRRFRADSTTRPGFYKDLRVEADDTDLRLIGRSGASAGITNYAFGQLAQRAGAPAAYLRKLPATLAAQNLNHGLKERGLAKGDDKAALLFHSSGDALTLRATLSEKYTRIWNHEILERLVDVQGDGWRTPPARPAFDDPRARPATEADVLRVRGGMLSVEVGDLVSPAGLYASDRDMFAFLINEDRRVDDGTPEGLSRFVMLWNSEVGDSSLGMMCGLYKTVCGNHIVWDASNVSEFRVRHVGNAAGKAFGKMRTKITTYADARSGAQEEAIKRARFLELGATKEETIDAVLSFARKKRITALTEKRVGAAFDAAEAHRDWYSTPPTTAWGVVQGLTEVAQQEKHTDTRTAIDRAAGRVIEMAF